MCANALVTVPRILPGITDDLEELVRRGRIDRLEDVRLLTKGGGKYLQHPDRQSRRLGLIAQHHRLQFGQRIRPLVGALKPRPGRRRWVDDLRVALGAEVDLLAPIGLAAGMLEPGSVVAAKVRRIDHLNRELVLLCQRKEAPR